MKSILSAVTVIAFLLSGSLSDSGHVFAQGTAHVTVTGIPPLLPSPAISDFISAYESGLYSMQILYSSPNQMPAMFRLKISLSFNGLPVLESLSQPFELRTGALVFGRFTDHNEIIFSESLSSLLLRLPSQLRDAADRGVFQEGLYQLAFELVPESSVSGIVSIPSNVFFSVQYAQAPVLFAPGDGSVVAQPQPIFSWTPVTVPASVRVEYELEIAEIIGDQTPLQAIEGSTYPVVRTSIADQTIFVHTQEFLPFEPGRRYAWRVTARSANNDYPFVNDGRSQIQVFDFMEAGARREHFRNLAEIIIEPGFARLTNFQRVRFREDGFAYRMNGPSTLELTTGNGVIEIPVQLNDLMIQKTGLENAILMGGQFDGSARVLRDVAGMPDIMIPDMLKWAFGEGFSIEARIELPGGLQTPLAGTLRYGAGGFSGELYSTQNPVFELIDEGRGIAVNSISAQFPGGQISASGELILFNGTFRCPVRNISLNDEGASASVFCNGAENTFNSDQPNVSESGLEHRLDRLNGYIAIDYSGTITDLDLNIDGKIGFSVFDTATCHVATEFNVGTDSFELLNTIPRCISESRFNLGFGEVNISRLQVNRLSWNAESGWEIEIEAAADISLAFNPDGSGGSGDPLRLPEIDPVIINEKGIRFPEIHFDEFELEGSPRFGMDELRVKVRDFKLPAIEFSWDEATRFAPELPRFGKPEIPGSWVFEMEGDMEFGAEDLPAGPFTGSECLRDARLTLTDGRFSNGTFSGSIDAIAGGDTGTCTFILASGSSLSDPIVLEVRSIGGDVTGAMSLAGFTSAVKFRGDGRVTGGPYIRCNDGQSAAEGRLDITPRGNIRGALTVTASRGCDLPLGPYDATLTEGTITVETDADSVKANLSAGVSVRFPTGNGDNRTATGTFRADLVKPEILELDITVQGPIALNFPEEDPVLQFILNEARLTPEGLRLAGTQALKTDGVNINTRFEDVLVPYTEPGLASGRIIIDDGLTLLVDLTDNPGIRFRVREYDSLPEDMKFAALMLEGPIVIDSTGIALNGMAHGALRLGHADLPELQVLFKDDFRLQPDPFEVVNGRAEFIYEDTRIAWLDRDGLHADPSFFQYVAPERILLPVEQVAYIDLMEDGERVLELEPQEDGRLLVRTIPGRQARLTVPALQGTQAEPPSYFITLDDVLLDPMTMSVARGSVTAVIPDQNGINLQTQGIPLQLRRIIYGDMDYTGLPVRGLYLEGDLNLFDTPTRSTEPAYLMVMADGSFEAYVRLTGIDTGFPVTGDGRVRFALSEVEGQIRIPGLNTGMPYWDLRVDGEFIVAMNGQPSASAQTSLRYQPESITVNAVAEGIYNGSSAEEMEGFFIRVDRINTLSLSYSTSDGFDFYSNTDLTFGFRTKDETFMVPVSSVAMHPDGFSIPEQERHRHSSPPLNLPPFEVDGIRMLPLATRIPAIEIEWGHLDTGAIPGFLPRFDFEITFPGFMERSPQLAEATMTLADAGLTDGILSGSILPYTFSGDGVPVPLTSPSLNPPVLYVKTIGGGIRRVETAVGVEQKLEFTFAGKLRNLPSFRYPGEDNEGTDGQDSAGQPGDNPENQFESCIEPDLTVGYIPPMGFEAVLSDVKPCGRLQMGPVGIEVDRSEIIFTYNAETRNQSLHLEGDVSIYLPHPQEEDRDTRIAGVLGLDLMTGRILEGSVEITEAFRWNVPDNRNPLFRFGVTRARLDMNGLTLEGDADLLVENEPVSARFEQYRYSFEEERFVSGRTIINSRLGVEIELSGSLGAKLVDPESPFSATSAVRFTSEGTVVLDHEGVGLTGSSMAALRLGENDYPSLEVRYQEQDGGPFTIRPVSGSTSPVQVTRGRAELWAGDSRIGWYDRDGIHLDNVLAALPIPDRIGLPTEDIAYLQLRDEQGELVAETENTGNGYILRTRAGKMAELVLNGFDQQNPPIIRIGFEVEVDDAFVIRGGRIEVEMDENPLDMQPFTGVPVRLVSLRYEQQDGTYRLGADARLMLPGELEEIPLIVHDLRFGPRGFEQADAEIGSCTEQYDPDLPAIASRDFGNNGSEIFSVMGVRVYFGAIDGACVSGTLASTFLKGQENDVPEPVFYRAVWEMGDQQGRWATRVEFTGGQDIPIADATLTLNEMEAIMDQDGFNVIMSGLFSVPDLMGSSFTLGVEDLSVGTNGVSVRSATAESEHEFNLFENRVKGLITRFELEITEERIFYVSGDGWLKFMDHPMGFTNLRIGTDGSFSIDQADLLPGETRLTLIENTAWLDTLKLSVIDRRLALRAGGSVVLPDPVNASGLLTLGLTVDEDGSTTLHEPFIGLIFGPAGDQYALGDSPLTEIGIGSLATLAVTGVAIELDLDDITNSTFYANAILFMENSNEKRIYFGGPEDIKDKPGFRIQRDSDPLWNVRSDGSNLFSFDTGFFRFQVDGVRTFNPEVFGVEIDGEVGLVIAGDDNLLYVREGFSGLQIAMPDENNPNPVRKWPDFAGLSVTIMDIVSLELGVFDFGIAATPAGVPFTIQKGDNPDNITEETIYVMEYLRFYNPLEGASAISISLTDAFSGGVEEILIYRDIDDNFLLYIKNAELSLASVGSLNINFRMLIGPGQLSLLAAGGGNLTGLGGMAVAGKFGIVDQGAGQLPLLSFGVFFAIRSETPIPFIPPAPPAIGLVGIGGGFFFRPEETDLQAVYSAVGAMDKDLRFMLEKRGIPPADANFAAMLYARFAMVGQGPINAYEGALFMELTDNYVNMIAVGSLVKQTGRLTAGMTATLNWSTLSLSGRLAAIIDYNPAVGGEGDLGFTLAINVPQQRLDWVVDGGFEANVVGIPATGSMVVSPAGFYAEMGLNANYSLLVVSLDGNFTARTWVIPDYNNPLNSEIGAFAQVDFKVDLLLASVNAVANGTFVIKNQEYSLYMLAELSADIIGTDGAAIWAFAELKNNSIVAADILYEVDENITRLISEAGDMANEMNKKANDAKTAVENATGVFDTKLSDEILAQAGENYLNFTNAALGWLFSIYTEYDVMKAESFLYTPNDFGSIQQAFQWVNKNIKTTKGRPDKNLVDDAFDNMDTELLRANQTSAVVQQLIDETRAKAVEWVAQGQRTFDSIEPPVTLARQAYTTTYDGITINSSVPFSVDTEKTKDLSSGIDRASEIENLFIQQVDTYLAAIDDAVENLSRLNAILHGSGSTIGIIAQGNKYAMAREAIGEYFARRANYFHEKYHWANSKHEALKAEESTIKNAVLSTIQAYLQMPNRTAAVRCQNLEIEVLGDGDRFNYVDCGDRYGLAQVVAMVRRMRILAWSGSDSNIITQEVNNLSSDMDNLRNQGLNEEFNNIYRETGDEYWFEMLDLGFQSFSSDAAKRAIETNNQRISTLNTIVPAHRTFTQSLDSLYVLKARMVENLYAMTDAFLYEYERAGLPMNDSRIVELQNRRNSYANMLLPATISSLSVESELIARNDNGIWYDKFINRSSLKWSAAHPVRVSEYSLGIVRGHQSSIPSASLFSTGNAESYLHWTYFGYQNAVKSLNITQDASLGSLFNTSIVNPTTFTAPSEPTLDFTATVRARGEAGYTSSRSVQFQALVEKPEFYMINQITGSNPSTTIVAPTTGSVPTTPIISLNGATRHVNQQFSPTYWWFESGRADLTLTSSDAGSGIQRFEMAVGTSATSRNIMPWTRVTGTRQVSGNTVTMNAIVRNLNLIAGGNGNYIHVRSVNNENRYSNPTVIRVFVDETRPVTTGPTMISDNDSGSLANPYDLLRSTNLDPGLIDGSRQTQLVSGTSGYFDSMLSGSRTLSETRTIVVNPEFHTIRVPEFTDPESGLKQIEYIESTEARLPLSQFEAGNYTVIDVNVVDDYTILYDTEIEAPVSFRDSSYVYFRALNNAGLYSDIVSVSYKTRDLTSPSRPSVQFNPVLDGLRLSFEERSSDPETGVTGVQYAIGSGPGMADIKPWPEQNRTDFDQPQYPTVSRSSLTTLTLSSDRTSGSDLYPYTLIPNTQLPMDQTFYISLRTLNGQGLRSSALGSGPLYISRKPPEFQNVTVSATGDAVSISGEVSDSVGITHITYRIRDIYNGDILGEGDLYGPVTYSSSLKGVQLNRSVQTDNSSWRHSIKVQLTAENASGLVRNFSQDILLNATALDETPPPSHFNMQHDVTNKRITMSWGNSPSPYLRRYEIVAEINGEFTILAETDARTTNLTLEQAAGSSGARYGVRAISSNETPSRIIYSDLLP